MAALPDRKITVDEFLAWSQATPGRFELLDGRVYEMQSERAVHARVKFAIQTALSRAIERIGLPCEMFPDGMTVRIDTETAFEPDALVTCGPRVGDTDLEVKSPVIIVEILSPSTRNIDAATKFASYFRVPSVMHYLIVNPEHLPMVHHVRQPDGTILTRIVSSGLLKLDPPGIEIDVETLLK